MKEVKGSASSPSVASTRTETSAVCQTHFIRRSDSCLIGCYESVEFGRQKGVRDTVFWSNSRSKQPDRTHVHTFFFVSNPSFFCSVWFPYQRWRKKNWFSHFRSLVNKKTILSLDSFEHRSEFCWMIYVTSYQGNSMNLSSRLSVLLPVHYSVAASFFHLPVVAKRREIPVRDCFCSLSIPCSLLLSYSTFHFPRTDWLIGRQIYSLHLHHEVIRRRETVRKFFSFPIVSIAGSTLSLSLFHFSIDLQCYKHIIKWGSEGY